MHEDEEYSFDRLEDFENKVVRPKPGWTLIAGSKVYPGREDRRKRYEKVIGVDDLPGEGVDAVLNLETPYILGSLSITTFSHIDCISVLEHTPRPWLVAKNLEEALGEEGTIFITVPFIWREHAYPDDYWRFTKEGLKSLFTDIEWKRVCYAHHCLQDGGKLPGKKVKGYPFYARTQVFAFGVKRRED